MNCLYSLFSELQDILMALRSHPLRCMYTPTTRRSGGNPLFSFLSLFRLLLFFFLSLSLHGDLERETLFVTAATGPDSSVHPTARASSVCTPGQAGSGPPNCTPCPADSYAPFPGMSKCMPCPAQASTLGATGASSITQCACGAGYYLDTQLATCANCPAPQGDFFCPGGFTPANVAQRCSTIAEVSGGGWWLSVSHASPSSSSSSNLVQSASGVYGVYQACRVEEACIGACGQCKQGHYGPLCEMCVPNWTRNYYSAVSLCEECPSKLILIAIHVASIVSLAIFLFVCFLCANHSAREKLRGVDNDKRSAFVPAVKMLLVFLAVWGVYGLQADLSKAWIEVEEDQNRGDSTTAPREGGAEGSLPASTTKTEGGTSTSLDSVTAATPRYFVLYVAAARFILLFSVAAQKVDCWFDTHYNSPLYLYTLFAFCIPLVLLFLVASIFTAVFLLRKNKPPGRKKLYLQVTKTRWRDVLAQKLTGAFWLIVFAFLLFWIPGATTYFVSSFQCQSLASGSRVQLFDPTVTCTGKSFQNATRLALPGLFLWTFGVPVCIFLSLLYYLSSLEEVRYTLVFTFVCDFYRKKLCWWDSLRLTFISLLIFVALYPFPTGKSSFLTILISLYTACFALVKPYGSETIEPWIVLKKNRCTRGIKLPRTHHLRELLMWIDLALAFQFDSIRISLPNDVRRRAMEMLVVLFFSLGKLLLFVWVIYEVLQTLLFYVKKKKEIQAGEVEVKEVKKVREFLEFGGDMEEYEQMIRHKFLKKDELFFLDASRLSPFPEEALAQLHTFILHDDLSACDILSAADFLFDRGHIELQGQTLYVVIPRISSMYSDLTYDISTTSEFSEELHKLLAKVAATLKLEANVKERLAVAKKIREKYKIVGAPKSLSQSLRKRRRRRKKFLVGEEEEEDLEEDEDREDWGKLLGGVETSADVQMEWLRMRMHPEDHSLNLTKKRAEFTLLFPSAKPVSYQDGNEEDEEEEDRHDGTEGETSPGFFAKVANALLGEPGRSAPSDQQKQQASSPLLHDPLDVRLHPTPARDLLQKNK